MIIAGEASGDLHGAPLIKKLKEFDSEVTCFGIGGDKMISEGFNVEYHVRDMAFLGFVEVIRHLPYIKKVQRRLIEIIKEKDIKTVVLIDYPGFNLNFAKKVKKLGINIVYYISPQIWAWGQKRIKKIKRLVDEMIVVFPFEKEFYESYGVKVEFVGHPLIQSVDNYTYMERKELFDTFSLNKDKEILLLLPGSRKQEIEKIFPETIKAAEKLSSKFNMQTVVACPENIDKSIFESVSSASDYRVVCNHSYDLMKYAKFGIIKSGTSTIEAALFKLPFIVVYATSGITYRIGKALVKIKHIAMANIILGKTVVDEFIQDDVECTKIVNRVSEILSSNDLYTSISNDLELVRNKLGIGNAPENAAKLILKFVNGKI